MAQLVPPYPILLASAAVRAYYSGMIYGSLDLDIDSLARPGRRAKHVVVSGVRELRVSDIQLLAVNAETKPCRLQRISERHHALARMLAAGVSYQEAGAVIGYDPARISVLTTDPAFAELVEFYRGKVTEQFMSTMDQLSGLSQDAIKEIRDRLEDNPEDFSIKDLREIMTATLDRSGFGPTHKQITETTVNLAVRLEEGRKRALEARRNAIRDITPPAEAAE